MKIKYACEICKQIFDNEQGALACEKGHVCQLSVTGQRFLAGQKYPLVLGVTFGDGTKAIYDKRNTDGKNG